MNMIRYSKGFKLQLVREVETGQWSACAVQRKYNIKGTHTVMRWVRQYGSGRYGKVIRVEQADEVNEATRLRSQLCQAKEALADAHMELALEKAFLAVACEQMGQTAEAFKKACWAAAHLAIAENPRFKVIGLWIAGANTPPTRTSNESRPRVCK